jgi:hypothetical protein
VDHKQIGIAKENTAWPVRSFKSFSDLFEPVPQMWRMYSSKAMGVLHQFADWSKYGN